MLTKFKNVIYFTGGIISMLVVGLFICLNLNIFPFKDTVASIVTGTVSLAALIVNYLISSQQATIQKQHQQIQVKTTIQKEWVEKTRTYLSEIIAYYLNILSIISRVNNENRTRKPNDHINYASLPEYKDQLEKFVKNRILLSLHLNFSIAEHKNLFNLTDKLWHMCLQGDVKLQADDVIKEIQNTAHELFEKEFNKPVH